ncbi:DUF6286 domain-containing protein [Streptomyces amakusaensis]|uniref:DUF6286 domain-containing protein n=1 Tax=Streptomyces amakusaensis TaxID=67271 RepID=A0ABW0AG93_9ACTN
MTRPPEPPEPPEPAGLSEPGSPGGPEPDPSAGPFLVPNTKAGRFWSVRRVPAALLAAAVLGGAGVLLYDIAAVRADHPAMRWRRVAAARLAEWRLEDPWVLAGAAVAAVLGVCLIVLALTPGLRRLLPMRRDEPSVRAGLTREAAALVVRDRAMEVPGVRSVRVRMGRSKVSVRADSHFRELDDVRTDLDGALDEAIAGLGLAKRPSTSVRVTRPPVRKR